MTRPFPGAVETVAALAARGHPVGVVTAKTEEGALRTLRHIGVLPFMGAIVGADTCARCKPDPEPVHVALARLERAPQDALLVGDSAHDVAAARAAGVQAIGVSWGVSDRATLERAGAERVVDDLREIVALAGAGRTG
jgi:pyrophosphatase PpaX